MEKVLWNLLRKQFVHKVGAINIGSDSLRQKEADISYFPTILFAIKSQLLQKSFMANFCENACYSNNNNNKNYNSNYNNSSTTNPLLPHQYSMPFEYNSSKLSMFYLLYYLRYVIKHEISLIIKTLAYWIITNSFSKEHFLIRRSKMWEFFLQIMLSWLNNGCSKVHKSKGRTLFAVYV